MKEYFIEYMFHGEHFLYRDILKSDREPQELLEDLKRDKTNLSQVTIRLNNFVVYFWKS